MAEEAPAIFFDGRSSRRHLVALVVTDRLEIAESSSNAAVPAAAPALDRWPYDTVRRVDGPDGVLRLTSTTAPPLARLEIRDPGLQAQVLQRCGALDGPGSFGAVSIWRIAAASLAAGIMIIAMAWFGMPLVANRLAAVIPYGWEKPLGDAVNPRVRTVFGAACTDTEGVAALHRLVAQLQSVAKLPLTPEPVVLRSRVPNAFALPGGRIYVLSNLIDKATSPDELGGVLAHEMGHVAHRDSLRRLIRNGGTSFLVGLLFGDVTGSGAVLMAGRTVLSASYSRADEARADAFAVTVMHGLGRPTTPLGDLLHRITGNGTEEVPSLLRDHPLTPDRMAMLKAANAPATGPALLSDSEWLALKDICDRR